MDPVEELRYRVLAIQRDGNRELAAMLRPLGVTPAQAEVLTVLARAGEPLTVRQVGELLVCEPGSPSRLVASLVKAGLVARGAHPDDARAAELTLTPQGERTAAKLREVDDALHAGLRERLGSQRAVDEVLRLARRLSGDGASAAALERRLDPKGRPGVGTAKFGLLVAGSLRSSLKPRRAHRSFHSRKEAANVRKHQALSPAERADGRVDAPGR